ncbi:MAG: hypothetical protein GKR77_07255 [Legionellales bacterium]|nr:hypothetical protein [Legionellales bacterium]
MTLNIRRRVLALILGLATGLIGLSAYADDTETETTPVVFPADTSTWPYQNPAPDTDTPWYVLAYYGQMTSTTLTRVVFFKEFATEKRTHLFSLEGGKTLTHANVVRRIFEPFVSDLDFALNFTLQDDPVGTIFQVNPFLRFVWKHFPWDRYVITTFAVGEGVSYSSKIPSRELRDTTKAANARRFLNFLMFEATFSLPQYPQWQLIYRIHHRSGVFGLYTPGIVGSTAMGVAVRYWF